MHMYNVMYGGDWGPGQMMMGNGPEWFSLFWLGILPFMAVFVLWSVFWKGLALWHSARRGQYWWFLAILVINTAGILEIIYLFVVAKVKLAELFSPKTHTEHAH